MNTIESIALIVAVVGVIFGILVYVGAAMAVARVLRFVEYLARLSGAALATVAYIAVVVFGKLVWAIWRDSTKTTYYAVKDLLSLNMHIDGSGNLFFIIIIELMFLVFSFIIIVGMIVCCLVDVATAPFWIVLKYSVLFLRDVLSKMIERNCK